MKNTAKIAEVNYIFMGKRKGNKVMLKPKFQHSHFYVHFELNVDLEIIAISLFPLDSN